MKKLIVLMFFIAVVIVSLGQVGSAQDDEIVFGSPMPGLHVSAKTIERVGAATTWRFRDSVRIMQDTTVITADEVDAQIAPDGTLDYDLRGNVHIKLGHK